MEKTITINPVSSSTNTSSNNPEKKLTQINLAKKAAIQSILEKYNLKTPKKSKTNAVPTDYEIKPKDANQIIHVSKSTPSTPSISNKLNRENNVSSTSNISNTSSKSMNGGNINTEIQDKRETKSAPTSPLPQSKPQIQQANKELASPEKKIVPDTKVINVKELLERDKAANEAKKNEMPSAIIQKGSGNSSISSSRGDNNKEKINIYNFIPKVRPSLPDIQPHSKQYNHDNSNNVIVKGGSRNSNDSSNIKRVSINPNLNEEESLNYKGQPESITTSKSSNRVSDELTARIQSRTPSPIRNIQNERLNKPLAIQQSSHSTSIQPSRIPSSRPIVSPETKVEEPREQRRIQIQTSGSGSGKQARALRAMQPMVDNTSSQRQMQGQGQGQGQGQEHNQTRSQLNLNAEEETEGNNSGLHYLEEQRKALQRQQLLELQRFKQKKAEIIKLNNRKKEIELMRSIEAEKNKLRKIHAKQQELNEIYKTTVEKNVSSGGGGGGTTIKNQTINTYDVDAKRTKKNLSKFIEPTEKAHIKSGKLKNNSNISSNNDKVDKTVLEKTDKPEKQVNADVIEVVEHTPEAIQIQKGGNINKKEDVKENVKENVKEDVKKNDIENEKKDKKESAPSKTTIKKELKPGEPLKYYTRKDKQVNISWPSKFELYDSSKFEDTLDIFLSIAPFFNKKQIKNKTSQEDILKELKEEYGFQKLDKFKPALLEVLYKIIIGDKIKFTFE